jgi:hypothetical protein
MIWTGQRLSMAVIAVVALVVLSGCGVKAQHPAAQHPARVAADSRPTTAGAKLVAARLGVSATLPASFGTPTFLAGNPSGAGAWVWDSTANSRDALAFVNASGKARFWPVLSGAVNSGQHGFSGFAVSGHAVWIGINRTLIRLDTGTGRTRTWPIPATRPLTAAGTASGGLPASVQALAVSPRGMVAVAMSQSSAVQVLDPASGAWRQIPLPAVSDEGIAVGYSSAGVLGVGFASHVTHLSDGFMITRPGRALTTTVGDAWEVEPYGPSGFLVGSSHPDLVSAAGSAVPLSAPAVVLDPTGPAEPPAFLPGGQLAFITETGIIRLAGTDLRPQAGSAGTVLALPQIRCAKLYAGISFFGGIKTHLQHHGRECSTPILLMTTDKAGNIWIITQTHPNTIAELQPANS